MFFLKLTFGKGGKSYAEQLNFLIPAFGMEEQTPGVNFSIKEKIAIARQLEKWGISAIEAGFRLLVQIHL